MKKCPNCGAQNADDSRFCTECGKPIPQGSVCPHCGASINTEDAFCVKCGNSLYEGPETTKSSCQKKVRNRNILIPIVAVLLLLVIIFTVDHYFIYKEIKVICKEKKEEKVTQENEAYEYAMTSSDPLILQDYLDTYKDGDKTHRDSIQNHLNYIKQIDIDWQNAEASNSKAMLEDYIKKYPNSHNKIVAERKIDSIDWALAKTLNTIDGYNEYTKEHPYGEHADEANDKIREYELQD